MTSFGENTIKKTGGSGLGLGNIGNLANLLNQPDADPIATGPMEIPIDLIDEDPHQPRRKDNPGFSAESLEELAATIRLRGVKTPISVRESQEQEGRFIINHGARRTRASRIAGKTTIPGFVDNDYNEADQVIENIQRDGLTPREVADFIGREIAKGMKKGDIAKELGKSASFVSQHVTLLDLPDPIADAFNKDRCRDVTLINDLVTTYKKASDEVTTWLADEGQEITRGSVKLLREFLDDKRKHKHEPEEQGPGSDEETGEDNQDQECTAVVKKRKEVDPDHLKKAIIQVKHDDRPARLMLNRRPSGEGCAWLKYEDDGHEFEADLGQVHLVAVLEG